MRHHAPLVSDDDATCSSLRYREGRGWKERLPVARRADPAQARDLTDAVVLRPSQDRITALGDVITMSDQKDNQHWMVAQQDRSMTFDVGVVDLPASYRYAMTAEADNMIYVDADRQPEQDGLVIAPRLTFGQCAKKYA